MTRERERLTALHLSALIEGELIEWIHSLQDRAVELEVENKRLEERNKANIKALLTEGRKRAKEMFDLYDFRLEILEKGNSVDNG